MRTRFPLTSLRFRPFHCGRAIQRARRLLLCAAVALPLGAAPASAAGIYGTMSNFDVFNDTSTDAYGAELELEGIHSTDVSSTFPSHFDVKTVDDYSDGTGFGTRIRFTGYNFNAAGFLAPTVGQSTNGHFCVNIAGCEHFGFSVTAQPTATRYFWLDQNQQRIGTAPMSIPTPTWSYVPPANGNGAPVVRARVEMPEPAEVHAQKPDSVWMKVYKTEIERPVRLDELMSNNDDVVPEDESETETEWELLEGGKMDEAEDKVDKNGKSVVRRYEFFKYTGRYDEEHEPLSLFLDEEMDAPPADELGPFLGANMVAAILVAPAVPGDYDEDGLLTIADLDRLRLAIQIRSQNLTYDVDGSGDVTAEDQRSWVMDLRTTWFGDANLDGVFDSADLITVFQAGEYEDDLPGNSTWASGDWNADGEFDSGDLVAAFQDGGYDQGMRAVEAVPEPHSLLTWVVGAVCALAWRRSGKNS